MHPGYGLWPGGTPARGHVSVLALGPGVRLLRGRPRCTTPWLPAQRSGACADGCCNWSGYARARCSFLVTSHGHTGHRLQGHYKDINRTTQGACSAPAGRILGSSSMDITGRPWEQALHLQGASRVVPVWATMGAHSTSGGVSPWLHIWARIVEGSRDIGWDHCEAQGEKPWLPRSAWPLGDQPMKGHVSS